MTGLLGTTLLTAPGSAHAQTDYYNTDTGRPLQIEDAHPVERRAFEIQAAPLRVERARGGAYHWSIEPEVAYGLFPRTQIEIGLPLVFADASGGSTAGIAGIDLSMLYNLNAETAIPALAVGAGVILPVGHLAPDKTYGSIKGILTRTFTWARFHVNAQYTAGDALSDGASGSLDDSHGIASDELSRWLAGIAVDRAIPLRSLLLGAELYAAQPLVRDSDVEWNAGAGMRYQVTPRITIDAGIGRQLTGDEQAWHATFGTALAVGLPWYP